MLLRITIPAVILAAYAAAGTPADQWNLYGNAQLNEKLFTNSDSAFRKTRSLQDSDPGSTSDTHDSCETALLVQPTGPGDVIHVAENTTMVETRGRQRDPCSTDSSGFYQKMFYTFAGTGNAFFITTCDYPDAPLEGGSRTNLQLAQDVDCANTEDEPICLVEQSGFHWHCPGDTDGNTFVFQSEEGAEYLFSVETTGFGGGNYNLRVGELEVESNTAGATCELAEEITAPRAPPPGNFRSTKTITRTMESSYSPRYGELCPEELDSHSFFTSGIWFVLDAPEVPKDIWFSTCGAGTTVNSTTLSVMVQEPSTSSVATEPCSPETHMCFRHSEGAFFSSGCAAGKDRGETKITSKPGERYYVYVASDHPFVFGDVELNITTIELEGTSGRDIASAERERREKRRPGVECTLGGIWYEEEPTVPLTCRDGCLYCEETMLGSPCFNRTDTVIYDSGYGSAMSGYKLDIDYFQLQRVIKTFEYRELEEGTISRNTCEALLNGVACTTCQKNDCGSPTVDCSNVPEVDGTLWEANTVDLCSLDINVFSYGPRDQNVDGKCNGFLSELACHSMASTLEEEGMGCTCTLDETTGESRSECSTECGLFCNQDLSACGVRTAKDRFEASGEIASIIRDFDYITGFNDTSGPTFNLDGSYSLQSLLQVRLSASSFAGWSCDANSGSDRCAECQLIDCDDGAGYAGTRPFGMFIDCSNVPGEGVYDTCDSSLQIDEGPFQFLSATNGFDRCLDIAPDNAKCDQAIPLNLDNINQSAIVFGTTKYVADQSGRSLTCSNENKYVGSGLFYRVIGNGQWMKASTCFNETDFGAFPEIVEGSCLGEDNKCLELPVDIFCDGNGYSVSWETEVGKDYHIWVGEATGERGFFKLQIETFELIDPMTRCETELALLADDDAYDCTCSEGQLSTGVLECQSTCRRCDEEACLDHHNLTLFSDYGYFGTLTRLNFTGSGFEGVLGYNLLTQEPFDGCSALLIDRETLLMEGNATDCECEVITCADGRQEPMIDCSEYQEGFTLNLCTGKEVSGLDPLSFLTLDSYAKEYASCQGSDVPVTVEKNADEAVERTGADESPKDKEPTSSDSASDESTTETPSFPEEAGELLPSIATSSSSTGWNWTLILVASLATIGVNVPF